MSSGSTVSQMAESFKNISLIDWGKFAIWLLGIAILGGIWWEDKNSESEELSRKVDMQAELFSDRMTALSNRISSLESKQATAISDIGDVKSDIKLMTQNLSFLSRTIQERGEQRDRQITDLREEQKTFTEDMAKKFEHVSEALAENRLWMVQAIQQQRRQEPESELPSNRKR